MTLLLNYSPVLLQPTGIGVYANGILPALRDIPHVLLQGQEQRGGIGRLRRLAWTQLELPHLARRQRASLVFTPAPEGYLGAQSIPQVVMVHDLRPISHPDRSLQSLYFRTWVPSLLRRCRHILTNSQFTAAEIRRCTGLPGERITVIPLGYDAELFQPAPPPQLNQESSSGRRIPAQPYLLHVGQAYPHKNLRRLIEAFARIVPHHSDLQLLLAGKPHPSETPKLRALVEERGLKRCVIFRPYVPLAELPDLYRSALALVYPSLWEGFGLPVLEAMACGTPVLTSLGSGTEEAAGEAALLIEPTDLQALVTGLRTLVEQPEERLRLSRQGLAQAELFSWDRCGRATREVLERII